MPALADLLAQEFARSRRHYAQSDDQGRWITLRGDGEGGGTPVYIRDGQIEKGPKSLTGKSLDDLGSRSPSDDEPFALRSPKNKPRNAPQKQKELLDKHAVPAGSEYGPGVIPKGDGFIGVTQLRPDQLSVDPNRFQYKTKTNKAGVTDALSDVRAFRPEFAGQLLAWHDPKDGKAYVINGHHRHDLASRTGYNGPLSVYLIEAKDAQEARSIGALANMAAGHGTAIDAAKFIRDSGVTTEDLAKAGVSLKGKVAEEGQVLARLSDRSFRAVLDGTMREGRALAVARHVEDHDVQDELFKDIAAADNRGKKLTDGVVEEMAREAAMTPTKREEQVDLFGSFESVRSLRAERGMVKSAIRSELASMARTFRDVSKRGRAKRLADAGNVLDESRNAEIAQEASEQLWVLDQLVRSKGELSDAINRFSEQLANEPRRAKSILDDAIREVRPILQKALSGGAPEDGGSSERYSRLSAYGGAERGAWAERMSVAEIVRAAYERQRLSQAFRDEFARLRYSQQKRDSDGKFAPLDLAGWDTPIKQPQSIKGQQALFDDVDPGRIGAANKMKTPKQDTNQRRLFASEACEADQLPKSRVHYRPSRYGGPQCSTCRHYSSGDCDIVAGPVAGPYVCDLWTPDRQQYAAPWREEDHPRASDGRFGSKSGDHAGGQAGDASPAGEPAGAHPARRELHDLAGRLVSAIRRGGDVQGVLEAIKQSAERHGASEHLVQEVRAGIEAQYGGAANTAGDDTMSRYKTPGGDYKPERRALHDRIIGEMTAKAQPQAEPIAMFMGGGPASGKSSVINAGFVTPPDGVHVDPDEMKARLPEAQAGYALRHVSTAHYVHEESSDLSKMALTRSLGGRLHVTLDGTGDSSYDKLAKKVQEARAAGHRCVAHYVTCPTDVAVNRAVARGAKTGRVVNEAVIRETHASVSRVLPRAMQEGLYDEATLWDTSAGGTPVKVAESIGGQLTVHDAGLWKSFLAKGET